MAIKLPGTPNGIEVDRICHGSLVGDEEFELRGKTVFKGGHGMVSAVVVKPKPGFEFVQVPGKDGHFIVSQKAAEAPAQ